MKKTRNLRKTRFYDLREAKGVTQAEAAEALGVTPQAISALELGFHEPNPVHLCLAAAYYGCTMHWLAFGEEFDSSEDQPVFFCAKKDRAVPDRDPLYSDRGRTARPGKRCTAHRDSTDFRASGRTFQSPTLQQHPSKFHGRNNLRMHHKAFPACIRGPCAAEAGSRRMPDGSAHTFLSS